MRLVIFVRIIRNMNVNLFAINLGIMYTNHILVYQPYIKISENQTSDVTDTETLVLKIHNQANN